MATDRRWATLAQLAGDSDTTKTICFDLDGTLCTNTYGAYEQAEPFPWAIERLNELAHAGHRIVVFTARGTATGIDWRDTTRGQLERWGVRYHDLQLGKPSADVYVDDRAVHTTAWREGDAFAVPGFGLPLPADRAEELPGVLASQRTTVVESGRTYGGQPFLVHEHVQRLQARSRAAGIPLVPEADELIEALDAALARAGNSGEGDLVFTLAVSDGVTPAFLDMVDERAAGPVVTARRLLQVLSGLAARPAAIGGRLAAVIDDRLMAAAPRQQPGPLEALLADLARDVGVPFAAEPLDRADLDRATEVFEAVDALGLVPVAPDGIETGDDGLRPRLEAALMARAAAA